MSMQVTVDHGVHSHVVGELCPYCDQPIPNDRVREIKEQYEADQEKAAAALELRLAAEREVFKVKLAAEQEAARKLVAAEQESLRKAAATEQEAARVRLAAEKEGLKKKFDEAHALLQSQLTAEQEKLAAERETLESQVRAVSEKEKADLQLAHYNEKLKLTSELENMKRALEKKTNEELGGGAELDLFEVLKVAFPEDIISRVAKGVNGADVTQVVRKNGKAMGTIVYESKNVKTWNEDYVPKLLADKLSAKADHAVLSAYTLPPKCQQLTIRQGVVICSPARVLVVAELLRNQVIQMASLKIAGQERDEKTVALYEYITSGSFTQHLTAIDAANDKLVEVDATERKAHERTWEKRSQMIRASQKALSNLLVDVERITGVANSEEVSET